MAPSVLGAGCLSRPVRPLTVEASGRWRTWAGLPPALGLRRSPAAGVQRCPLLGALHVVRGLAEAERGHTGTAAEG